MPSIQRGDATIYYEEFGSGFPILTFAPAGLMSTIDVWRRPMATINPIAEFASEFRVIALDQRNAGGQSRAPISAQDGWDTYAADHIALLDHLGVGQCHLFGQCIGGPFIFSLLQAQPQRVASAVLVQTIGRVGPMPDGLSANFQSWTETLKDHPEATPAVLESFYKNLYDSGFTYSVSREFVASCQTPCLVLAGSDAVHPYAISEEVAKLMPHAEFVPEWKEGQALAAAKARIKQFLSEHTPVRA